MAKRIDDKYITGTSVFGLVVVLHALVVEIIVNTPL